MAAWCRRFINNALLRKHAVVTKSPFTIDELHIAKTRIVRMAQHESFPRKIQALSSDRELPRGSKLANLNPSLCSTGMLRVGGRLDNSEFSYDKRHPMILDSSHHLPNLISKEEHRRGLHLGSQGLLSVVKETYWPISGRNLAKKVVRQCITCFRHKPISTQQIMGHLPSFRVTPSYPFSKVGVDYGGPFMIRDRRGRGSGLIKSYLCLFICMSTRAVHFELAADLSTQSFILALRRFALRHGLPERIVSDNTNFVGAKCELAELGSFNQDNQNVLAEACSHERIKWCFFPAYSPHFGGIWQAGIKSSKHHMKRVIGNAHLTYEEFP